MNKSIVCLIFAWVLYAEVDWTSENEITLKRNEPYTMKILVGLNDTRELKFFWTLFVDEKLVFLAKYDSFAYQTLLSTDYKKNAWQVVLARDQGKLSPYVVVFFKHYDEKKQSATFKVVTYGDVFVQ